MASVPADIHGNAILAMAPTSGWPPLSAWWDSHLLLFMQYVAVINAAMMANRLKYSHLLEIWICSFDILPGPGRETVMDFKKLKRTSNPFDNQIN
jgi:hypothetical protein